MSFNPDKDLNPQVLQTWKYGAALWPALVKTAVALNDADTKYRDVDWLTSVVFYLHHPERKLADGTYRRIESGEKTMIDEWYGFQSMIRPMVPAAATTAVIEAGLNPVIAFVYMPIRPLALMDDPDRPGKQKVEGQFQVYMKLDPNIPDPGNYEYRQLIRGGASIQEGKNIALGVWTEIGEPKPVGRASWDIPGPYVHGDFTGGNRFGAGIGLHEKEWKEDGTFDRMADGRSINYSTIRHYGHRDRSTSIFWRGLERDEYKLLPLDGREYFLTDFPSLRGLKLEEGQRLKVDLEFQGLVEYYDKPFNIPGARKLSTVRQITWSYRFDHRITGISPIRSSPMAPSYGPSF